MMGSLILWLLQDAITFSQKNIPTYQWIVKTSVLPKEGRKETINFVISFSLYNEDERMGYRKTVKIFLQYFGLYIACNTQDILSVKWLLLRGSSHDTKAKIFYDVLSF